MIRLNGAELTVLQAEEAPIDELPLDNRSDEWWDKFWKALRLREAELRETA